MRRILAAILSCMSLCLAAEGHAGIDFSHPDFLSFEDTPGASSLHSKFGDKSLEWKWKHRNAELSIRHNIAYLPVNPDPEETSVSTFVFWVYSPKVIDGALTVEFLKEGRVCCHFRYGLGFSGWRGAWVAFDRDMEGQPEEGMDEVRFRVEGPRKGVLYFDGIIPAAFEDVRYHTADFQAPFINKGTNVHWIRLQEFWERKPDFRIAESVSASETESMAAVNDRFVSLIAGDKKGYGLKEARKVYDSYGIVRNPDGTVKGKPVFFTRYGETFANLGIPDASKRLAANGQLVKRYNDDMFRIALGWRQAEDSQVRAELARIYVDMTEHLLDQGFAAGSAMGTLHHLGYSMRNFYTAPVLMRDVLEEAGRLDEVQRALEWFCGLGEVKYAPATPGMDIDAFNTYLLSRLAAVLLIEDAPRSSAYMQALSRWVDNGFKYTGGTKACFKTDGTVFHHRKAYPAYAVGGFDGAVKAVWLFHGTPYAVSEESHSILKKALLEMRFYCNLASFPLAMSGRHPDGKGALIPEQYGLLAQAGSPDRSEAVDSELAAAYLRLVSGEGRLAKEFAGAGISPEQSPTGVRNYGYNCSLSARQDDWLVTIAGHSRYLWASEIYRGANHYGRYLTHGSMEIICDSALPGGDGRHVSLLGSGYQVNGYDWCHIPGTTAAVIPMEQMKAHVLNVDEYSGYEEMLLSDEWFAGGVGHDDNCGAFAMLLHEHDKYNGSLRARKSFFVFGNRIVCMGSDISSEVQPVHTTLFQNALPSPATRETADAGRVLRDRFGNAWIVSEGKAMSACGLQHSFHEETDAPTQGWFEKAWIENDTPEYEYMALVRPAEESVAAFSESKPYDVLHRNTACHAVRDALDGTVGAAVFEESAVDSVIVRATPCMLMYSVKDGRMNLSVSNPDLALYSGEADEVYDSAGNRVERSVYSRKWVNNDCSPVTVTIELAGRWNVAGGDRTAVSASTSALPESKSGTSVECSYADGRTVLVIHTAEARTEHITLSL